MLIKRYKYSKLPVGIFREEYPMNYSFLSINVNKTQYFVRWILPGRERMQILPPKNSVNYLICAKKFNIRPPY